FTAADDERAPNVAVINETLARRHFPEGGALGRTFRFRGEEVTVVGIARDAKYANLGEETPAFVYFPIDQLWRPSHQLLVRTEGDPLRLAPALAAAVRAIDPALPRPEVISLEEVTRVALLPQRVAAGVTGALGGVGLLLTAVGLYGMIAFAASRRTREIGVRMAFGARRADVLGLIVGEGLRLAGLGVLLGLLLAAAATRVMAGLLLGVSPLDAGTFLGAALLFVGVAAAASYLPARRAAAGDPVAALRAE
ncbi:MAG TPA: FtsX-like permease family protein, partial [Thermoanaerobaculia bacterium]|nr:FtsX-like permease family protein [Thermoanaerobaculia bacterium]